MLWKEVTVMAKRILWVIWQALWGLPQNLAGGILFLLLRRSEHIRFHGAVVTAWRFRSCCSIGCFIFMDACCLHDRRLLVHEFGHTVQSAILGWLYLPVIALPSAVWFSVPALRNWRRRTGYSYYRFYTERWANHLGEVWCGEPSMGRALID